MTSLAEARSAGASRIYHFGVKLESLRLHATKRTHNHIQQNDAVFFARDVVGIADDDFVAMLTNQIHVLLYSENYARPPPCDEDGNRGKIDAKLINRL